MNIQHIRFGDTWVFPRRVVDRDYELTSIVVRAAHEYDGGYGDHGDLFDSRFTHDLIVLRPPAKRPKLAKRMEEALDADLKKSAQKTYVRLPGEMGKAFWTTIAKKLKSQDTSPAYQTK